MTEFSVTDTLSVETTSTCTSLVELLVMEGWASSFAIVFGTVDALIAVLW